MDSPQMPDVCFALRASDLPSAVWARTSLLEEVEVRRSPRDVDRAVRVDQKSNGAACWLTGDVRASQVVPRQRADSKVVLLLKDEGDRGDAGDVERTLHGSGSRSCPRTPA